MSDPNQTTSIPGHTKRITSWMRKRALVSGGEYERGWHDALIEVAEEIEDNLREGVDMLSDAAASPQTATKGHTALVKGRPNYKAVIESDSWGRLTVRPLPDQGVTTRSRAIWRKAVLEVVGLYTPTSTSECVGLVAAT